MKHWKIGGVAIVLVAFVSSCAGSGSGSGIFRVAGVFNTDCVGNACSYDNGDTLVLIPNPATNPAPLRAPLRSRFSFTPGAAVTGEHTVIKMIIPASEIERVQVNSSGVTTTNTVTVAESTVDIVAPLARQVRDGRVDATPAGDEPNMLRLGGVDYALNSPGAIEERNLLYPTVDEINGQYGGLVYAWGYNTFFRFPDQVLSEDNKDIVTGGFTIIKSTLSNDYLALGVGVSLQHQERITPASGTVTQRYRPVEHGSFVSGTSTPTADLPNDGLAAYAGFSQAYAQSDNLDFLPFDPIVSKAGNIATGLSAMVFSFSDSGAKFEHGFISLVGSHFADLGTDETDSPAVWGTRSNIRSGLTLSANFASPEFRSTSYATVIDPRADESQLMPVDINDPTQFADLVDNTGTPNPAGRPNLLVGHTPNPHRDYYLSGGGVDANAEYASGLFFHLDANDQTDDGMDFTMRLMQLVASSNCVIRFEHRAACYPSGSEGNTRGGLVSFYGSTVSLTADSSTNNAQIVPLFAGGVWQYEGLVYVVTDYDGDQKDGNTADPDLLADDRLLGVVDLYGSFGGLIVDNPACPTSDPTCSPSP